MVKNIGAKELRIQGEDPFRKLKSGLTLFELNWILILNFIIQWNNYPYWKCFIYCNESEFFFSIWNELIFCSIMEQFLCNWFHQKMKRPRECSQSFCASFADLRSSKPTLKVRATCKITIVQWKMFNMVDG